MVDPMLSARAWRLEPVHIAIAVLIGAVFLAGSWSSDRFASAANMANVSEQLVVLALVALAQTLVILSGGIDLSYAGMMSLMSVLFAGFAGETGTSFALAAGGILCLGLALGALNGALTAYTAIHPLIVTLGTSTILAGLALLYRRQPAGQVPIFFEDLVYLRIGGVPFGTLVALGCYALFAFVLWNTRFGLNLYALGDDPRAAAVSGVPVARVKVITYALSGGLVALASLWMVGRLGVGDPRAGVGFDLRSITPVIVGGTLLAGGHGGVVGTLLAVVLLALLANMLNFMNVSSYVQWIVEGLVVLVAVSFFARKQS